jgi:hypothetical protein
MSYPRLRRPVDPGELSPKGNGALGVARLSASPKPPPATPLSPPGRGADFGAIPGGRPSAIATIGREANSARRRPLPPKTERRFARGSSCVRNAFEFPIVRHGVHLPAVPGLRRAGLLSLTANQKPAERTRVFECRPPQSQPTKEGRGAVTRCQDWQHEKIKRTGGSLPLILRLCDTNGSWRKITASL